jgi:hypothetical protein
MAIESDGGSSKYYEIHVPANMVQVVLDSQGDPSHYVFQVEHVIEFGLGNDFDKGNLFKVLYRFGNKAGNTLKYELNKMQYSLNKLRQRFLYESDTK